MIGKCAWFFTIGLNLLNDSARPSIEQNTHKTGKPLWRNGRKKNRTKTTRIRIFLVFVKQNKTTDFFFDVFFSKSVDALSRWAQMSFHVRRAFCHNTNSLWMTFCQQIKLIQIPSNIFSDNLLKAIIVEISFREKIL